MHLLMFILSLTTFQVGLFGVSLRPYLDCRVPDITVVPVSITYEERMEAHSYAKEMLGVR